MWISTSLLTCRQTTLTDKTMTIHDDVRWSCEQDERRKCTFLYLTRDSKVSSYFWQEPRCTVLPIKFRWNNVICSRYSKQHTWVEDMGRENYFLHSDGSRGLWHEGKSLYLSGKREYTQGTPSNQQERASHGDGEIRELLSILVHLETYRATNCRCHCKSCVAFDTVFDLVPHSFLQSDGIRGLWREEKSLCLSGRGEYPRGTPSN